MALNIPDARHPTDADTFLSQGFGYSTVSAQLMSVIIYACALVGINFFARIADKTNRHGLPLIAANSCALLGYILLLVLTSHKARMAATVILAFGIYATIPISTTWLTLNVAGYTQRGAATAMMNMLAQAFAISGNQAYVDPPFCECAPSSPFASEIRCSLLTAGIRVH